LRVLLRAGHNAIPRSGASFNRRNNKHDAERFAGASGDPKSNAPTAIVWEKKEAVMQKSISRKIFALTFAVMMMASVFAASASAASGDEVVTTPINTQLWWADDDLSSGGNQFEQTLDITVNGVTTPTLFTLGNNTIQGFRKGGNTYEVVLHPQYFAPYTTTPNYDDSENAQYAHTISDVFVLAPSGRYVSCYVDGILSIPDAYALPTPKVEETYFQCKIYSAIGDLEAGEAFPPNWYGQIVYLKIQTD
jgi:hypothetical protein